MPSKSVRKPTPQQRHAREEYQKIPTRGKTEDPRRYTKITHDFDVLISGGKLGGPLERDLLYWIARHTVGANTSRDPEKVTRPEWAKLTLGTLAKLCQSWDHEKGKLRPAERKSVAVALARLQRDGIIEARDRTGCEKTTAKMYKLTPERWKSAPPYKPSTLKQIADAEAQAEEDSDAEPKPPEDAGENGAAPQTVQAGRLSRPQPVAIAMTKDTPAVTIRLVYHAEGVPLTFRSRTGKNGRVQITAALHQNSEEEAKRCSRAQLQKFAAVSPINSPASVESERVTSYSEWITDLCVETWSKVPDKPFLESIIYATKGAPIEYFKASVRAKAKAKKLNASGLLVYCAQEAAGVHEHEQKRQERKTAPAGTRGTEGLETPAEALARAQSEDWPCQACDGTGSAGNWNRGHFTPRKPAAICPKCQGRKEEAAQ